MTYVIAEVGNNHEGDKDVALQLTKDCIKAGADAIKFQAFTAEELVSPDMPSLVPTHETQRERMKSLELPLEFFKDVATVCKNGGVDFIVSPFSIEWVSRLKDTVNAFKVASGEITNYKLLLAIGGTNKDVFISTGMSAPFEVLKAIRYFSLNTCIMHCVSLYPCPAEKAGLSRITSLKTSFPYYKIGYSDHCTGYSIVLSAIAAGAEVIEKHVTTAENSGLNYGDHVHSITPLSLGKMIREINTIESMVKYDGLEDLSMRKHLRRGKSGLRGD